MPQPQVALRVGGLTSGRRGPVTRLSRQQSQRSRVLEVDSGGCLRRGEQPQQQRGVHLEQHLGGVGVQVGLGGAVQGAQRTGPLQQLQGIDERASLGAPGGLEGLDTRFRRGGVRDPVSEQADGGDGGGQQLSTDDRQQCVAATVEGGAGAAVPAQRPGGAAETAHDPPTATAGSAEPGIRTSTM